MTDMHTYPALRDFYLRGYADETATFDGLRALGFSWHEAREHLDDWRAMRTDQLVTRSIDLLQRRAHS